MEGGQRLALFVCRKRPGRGLSVREKQPGLHARQAERLWHLTYSSVASQRR